MLASDQPVAESGAVEWVDLPRGSNDLTGLVNVASFVSHCYGALRQGGPMGFSGMRAIIMVAVLIVLVIAVTKFDLPGWLLPVGLLATGALLKGAEKSASKSSEV